VLVRKTTKCLKLQAADIDDTVPAADINRRTLMNLATLA
jgi:hypothetical protein